MPYIAPCRNPGPLSGRVIFLMDHKIFFSLSHDLPSVIPSHNPFHHHSDGQKMSKRLKNYPDPVEVVHKYGADALRLYLVNSPVVRAEPLRFKERGVKDVLKDVFLPWFNAYQFLIQNVQRLQEVCVIGWVENVCQGQYIFVCM